MTSNHLTHKFQSAYRAGHSTEIALLRIVNDILTASDANQVSVLTLLDLSAAFDTIDHSILLCRLEKHFGFFLVLPSAGSSHTCQTGFSLFPHAAVTPSYPSLIWSATRFGARPNSVCAVHTTSFTDPIQPFMSAPILC